MISTKEFNFLAQINHVLGAAFAIVASVYLFDTGVVWLVAGVFTVYSAWKEFYWDYKNETEEVRGSSLEDFLFYMLGIVVGLAVVFGKSLLLSFSF